MVSMGAAMAATGNAMAAKAAAAMAAGGLSGGLAGTKKELQDCGEVELDDATGD